MARIGTSLSAIAARFGAGSLLIASLAIGGLLSVPTRCTCGADLPHEHSLFGLRHHYHGEAQPTAGEPEALATADGPSVTAPSGTGAGVAVATFADGHLAGIDRGGPVVMFDSTALAGRADRPDSPPPRA